MGASMCWAASGMTALAVLWVLLGYAVGLHEGMIGTGAIPFLFGVTVFLLVFALGPLLALLGLSLHAMARSTHSRAAWSALGALVVHAAVWVAVLLGPAPGV